MKVPSDTRCLTEEVIADICQQKLAMSEIPSIEEHLDHCDACRMLLSYSLESLAVPAIKEWSEEETTQLSRGTIVANRYMVLHRLGSGGMGVVYDAFDPELERHVALKLLRPEVFNCRETKDIKHTKDLLFQEARKMAQINHPNVISVYDIGFVKGESSPVFVAMELVQGPTAFEWIRQKDKTWQQVIKLFLSAGEGLSTSHDLGVIHGDFKPENILVTSNHRPLVTDFGVTHFAGDPSAVTTPEYAAPELAENLPTQLSDQYSFGRSLWNSLLFATKKEPPRWLRPAIVRSMSANPDDRFSSMRELCNALTYVLQKRRRRRVSILVLLVVIVGGGSLYTLAPKGHSHVTRCKSRIDAVASIWNKNAKDKLATGLGTNHFAQEFHAYIQKWTQTYTLVCQESQSSTISLYETNLKIQCLQERLHTAQAVLSAVSTDNRLDPDQGLLALTSNPPPTICMDASTAQSQVKPPPPESLAAVKSAQTELARLRVLNDATKHLEAKASSKEFVKRTKAIGYSPLVAKALLLHGLASFALSDGKTDAIQSLQEAVWLSLQTDDAYTAALAASHLVIVAGYISSDAKNARLWSKLAQALIRRLDHPDEIVGLLAQRRGQLAWYLGDFANASRYFSQAQTAWLPLHGERSVAIADIIVQRGTIAMLQGNSDEAIALQQQALSIYRDIAGDDSSIAAKGWRGLGRALSSAGHYKEALESLTHSFDLFTAYSGPNSIFHLPLYSAIADTYRHLEKFELSEKWYKEGILHHKKLLGPDHKANAVVHNGLVELYRDSQRATEGISHQKELLRIMKIHNGRNSQRTAEAQIQLASLYRMSGQYKLANRVCQKIETKNSSFRCAREVQ